MKRLFACFFALLVVATAALPQAEAMFDPPFSISAPAAYVVNTDTNIIVYQKDSETAYSSASLTKVMTAILVLEQYGDQLDTITGAMKASIRDALYLKGMSNADIRVGETHTLRALLYASLLPSAADAAMILADVVGNGSQDSFVYMMNAKAKEIGCTNTTFVDAVGMSLDNKTTARDMYLILRYAMSFDVFKEISATNKYDMGESPRYSITNPYMLYTTNMMVDAQRGGSYTRSYNKGGKTGSLSDWQNFASWHTSPDTGESYICVVLNSPNAIDPSGYPTLRPALYETGLLMDWVFESFAILPALDTSEPIAEISVKYSTDADTLMLYPVDDLKTILPLGTDTTITQKEFNLPEYVTAPVKQGDVVGTVSILLSGEVIGTVELVADRDLERNGFLFAISKVGEFFGSLYFKVTVVLVVLAVVGYLVLYTMQLVKRRNSKKIDRNRY